MTILIVYNSEKPNGKEIAAKASRVLENAGAKTVTFEFQNIADSLFDNITAAVVIGGDGTIIKVAKIAAQKEIPVLGVNAGRLGYLACVDSDKLELLQKIVTGGYTVENRVMLKAEKFENGVYIGRYDCLNDAVISKSTFSNMIDICVEVGNDKISYRADGLIAATPTGSTAYSLSAGGPVVDPALRCMILTPVCPHTLMTRSMVINGDMPVTIQINGKQGTKVFLSCDGRKAFELEAGSMVRFGISDRKACFIKLNNISVYKVFSENNAR